MYSSLDNKLTPAEIRLVISILACIVFPFLTPGMMVYYGIKFHQGIHRNEGK